MTRTAIAIRHVHFEDLGVFDGEALGIYDGPAQIDRVYLRGQGWRHSHDQHRDQSGEQNMFARAHGDTLPRASCFESNGGPAAAFTPLKGSQKGSPCPKESQSADGELLIQGDNLFNKIRR